MKPEVASRPQFAMMALSTSHPRTIAMKSVRASILLFWALLGVFPSHARDVALSRPNIVFVFSDDHSLQTIGAYRGRLAQFCREHQITPNMDRLAAQGGLLVNSFCGNSLCSPSRASILTGLHSHSNGVMTLGKPINPGLWTFPASLRDAGYQTAVIGKWHLGKTPAGTDHWELLDGQGTYWHPEFTGPQGKKIASGYATDVITDKSLDWLKRRDRQKPFMLMVHHKAPHRIWMPPPRYYSWLQDVHVPEPATLFDDYQGRASPARTQKMEISRIMTMQGDLKVIGPGYKGEEFNRMSPQERADWDRVFGPRNQSFHQAKLTGNDLTRWKYQEYMKDYLRCIKAVDDGLGRLLDYLKSEGLDGNTVVIYASDQGFFNGEHGWFDKRWIYEESIHMPFIIRWPGVVKPGTRIKPFIQNIDYAPTFVEMAGGKVPEGLHGRSFLSILQGKTPRDWRNSVYYHYYDSGHGVPKHYGLRSGRYTLANYYEVGEWELFDNRRDPAQMKSVAKDPHYASVMETLKLELWEMRQRYGDRTGRW
jgi:arylsulfatase A-like enzyme